MKIKNKYLHIGNADKFLPEFIEHQSESWNASSSVYFLSDGMSAEKLKFHTNVFICPKSYLSRALWLIRLFKNMWTTTHIISHGLFEIKWAYILIFCKSLFGHELIWVIWGGEFSIFHKFVD